MDLSWTLAHVAGTRSTLRLSPGQAQQDLPLPLLCSSSRRTMAERTWPIRIPCHTLVGWGPRSRHAGRRKLRAVRSEQKETCCREGEATQGRAPVGGAVAPLRHTLSRLLVERSIPTTQNNTPNLLACLQHGHQAGQSIGCGSHHWTSRPLDLNLYHGYAKLQRPPAAARIRWGQGRLFGAACRISPGHSNRYPQIWAGSSSVRTPGTAGYGQAAKTHLRATREVSKLSLPTMGEIVNAYGYYVHRRGRRGSSNGDANKTEMRRNAAHNDSMTTCDTTHHGSGILCDQTSAVQLQLSRYSKAKG